LKIPRVIKKIKKINPKNVKRKSVGVIVSLNQNPPSGVEIKVMYSGVESFVSQTYPPSISEQFIVIIFLLMEIIFF